jgi:hypothetical protein
MSHASTPLKAVMLDTPPVIDGDLSDACWESVPPVTDFTYTDTGSPAAEKTIARLAYDGKSIYVAFDCKDSQPTTIRAQQKKRGGDLWSDDNVTIYLDMFSEYKDNSLCYFAVNPIGAQCHQIRSSETAKTEWAGDWEAATKMNPDGYSVEMRIPFSILKYDAANPKISLCFQRQCPRLKQSWLAPDIGKNGDLTKLYFWEGVHPPAFRTKPVVLLYTALGAGADERTKQFGGDVKYALTPGLTGLLTVNPFFRNVEQAVDSINFTYNERALGDNRLFFRESKQYFPGSIIFYTRRIQDIDTGLKIVGQAGGYQLGLMNARQFGNESYTVGEITRQFGAKKDFSVWAGGVLSQVDSGDYLTSWVTWDYKLRQTANSDVSFHHTFMTTDNNPTHGTLNRYTVQTNNGPRKLNIEVEHQLIDKDFTPYLGASGDKNMNEWGTKFEWRDYPEKGAVSYRGWDLWVARATHLDGSRFYNNISPGYNLNWRNGYSAGIYYSFYDRDVYHDRVWGINGGWNQNDLYQSGGFGFSLGNRVGGKYRYASLSQGFKLSDRLSASVWTEYEKISEPSPAADVGHQTVLTANYDINPERSIASRLILFEGKANIYFAYRQHVRAGLDAYLIYGDPNSRETKNTILLKLIRPI